MTLVDAVRESWGWCGIEPLEVVGENEFGNLIVKDRASRYWRLCPEDLDCSVIANDRAALDLLSRDQDFLRDWHMRALVDQAFERLGVLPEGKKYCLKIPGVLGGDYGGDNLAVISHIELILASGDIARQIRDLPEGAQVHLKVVD